MPAYPIHLLVAFGGRLAMKGASDEIWQCGIRCALGAPPLLTEAQQNAYLLEIAAPLNAWWTAAASKNRSDCNLQWIKANTITGNGGYYYNSTSRYDYPTPAAGANSNTLPSFLSCVYSWTTGAARGYNARGRIYPPNSPNCGPGATITTSDTTQLLGAAKVLLSAIANTGSAVPALRMTPAVIGPGTPDGTAVAPRPISGVRIGNVWDEQTRRKNALPETYVASAWP